MLHAPDVEERLAKLGAIVASGSPSEFGNLIKRDLEKWLKVIDQAGIVAE